MKKENFKRYLKANNLTKKTYKKIPHVRYETRLGKQLQVDWKENLKIITKHGEVLEFNLFAATLGASRLHYFIYSDSKTEEAFIRCLLDTFHHIGGLTKEVLTDNMSAIEVVLLGSLFMSIFSFSITLSKSSTDSISLL